MASHVWKLYLGFGHGLNQLKRDGSCTGVGVCHLIGGSSVYVHCSSLTSAHLHVSSLVTSIHPFSLSLSLSFSLPYLYLTLYPSLYLSPLSSLPPSIFVHVLTSPHHSEIVHVHKWPSSSTVSYKNITTYINFIVLLDNYMYNLLTFHHVVISSNVALL